MFKSLIAASYDYCMLNLLRNSQIFSKQLHCFILALRTYKIFSFSKFSPTRVFLQYLCYFLFVLLIIFYYLVVVLKK